MIAGATLLGAAALNDVATRTVPNRISAALAILGLAVAFQDGHLVGSLLTSLSVFALFVACWRAGWLGGGDVKLFAAVVLYLPPIAVPGLLAMIAIVGAGLALVYLLLQRLPLRASAPRTRSWLGRIVRVELRRIQRKAPLPYATAIAAGTVLAMLRS